MELCGKWFKVPKQAGKSADEASAYVAKHAEAIRKGTPTKPPVRPYEVDSYRNLNKRAASHDGLQHDHIPSKAALIKAEEKRKGRRLTAAEKKRVANEGTTVAIPDDLHAKARTTGSRNTPDQIAEDASDLASAAEKDLEHHAAELRRRGMPEEEIQSILENVRAHNRTRGIGQ